MTDGLLNAGVIGVGSYLPSTIVTNDDLSRRIDTSDEWIRSRTGIGARRVASAAEATSDLAVGAAERALSDAGITAAELDLVVVATCTPDHPGSFPSTGTIVQDRLGATKAAALDMGAVCAGFSYSLHIVSQMVRTGSCRYALVIGAETLSRIVNWDDRNTAVLFGDGAGAAVVGPVDKAGYLGGLLGADGSGGPLLAVPAGGSRRPLNEDCIASRSNTIFQNGREVYRFAVHKMGEVAVEAVTRLGFSTEQIDCFIPHQANIRIIASAAERMGLPMERVFVNLDRYGNTSAASIPIALDEAVKSGMVKSGSLVVMVGFGAGLTWGANVMRWA